MKKMLCILAVWVFNSSLSMAALFQIDWTSGGFYLGSPTPLLDPTGLSRPQSTLAQLIWTSSATISLAVDDAGVDFLTGGEILLLNAIINYTDVPSGEYAYWGIGAHQYNSDGTGLPVGYETGYIYARIFQSTTPTAGELYYAGSVLAANTYYWDGVTPPTAPLPPEYSMTGGVPQDVALSPYTVQPVPEPGTMALFAIGLVTLGAARRRRRNGDPV